MRSKINRLSVPGSGHEHFAKLTTFSDFSALLGLMDRARERQNAELSAFWLVRTECTLLSPGFYHVLRVEKAKSAPFHERVN